MRVRYVLEQVVAVELNQARIVVCLPEDAVYQVRRLEAITEGRQRSFDKFTRFTPLAIVQQRANTDWIAVMRQGMIRHSCRTLHIMKASEYDLEAPVSPIHHALQTRGAHEFAHMSLIIIAGPTIINEEIVGLVQQE